MHLARRVPGILFAFAAMTAGPRPLQSQVTESLSAGAIEEATARTVVGDLGAPRTFGLSDVTTHVLNWAQFVPIFPQGAANQGYLSHRRFCGVPSCTAEAPVVLPNGALIEAIELEACDAAPENMVTVLVVVPVNGDFVLPPGGVVPTSGTPGCTLFSSNLTPPVVVDNSANSYYYEIAFGNSGGSAISFRAVRVYYRLQVSPAPGVATFPNDVPTSHPFFRFIEALASAGITAGCAPQSYCPNNPITRGEMAVFLAAALGLHFPN